MRISAENLSYYAPNSKYAANFKKAGEMPSIWGAPKFSAMQNLNGEIETEKVNEKQPVVINEKNQKRIDNIKTKTTNALDKLKNTGEIVDKLNKSKIMQIHPFARLFKDLMKTLSDKLTGVLENLVLSQSEQMSDKKLEDKLSQIASEANSAAAKIINLDVKSKKISKLDDKLVAYETKGGKVEDIKLDEIYEKLSKDLNNDDVDSSDDEISEENSSSSADANQEIDDMENEFGDDEFSKKLEKAMKFLDGEKVGNGDTDFIDEKALAQNNKEKENAPKMLFNPYKFMNLRNNPNFRV
ncbi:hypothetical protein J6E39_08500 [bacterium]|nr:hypothetical protein [bacterium]